LLRLHPSYYPGRDGRFVHNKGTNIHRTFYDIRLLVITLLNLQVAEDHPNLIVIIKFLLPISVNFVFNFN